MPQTKSRRAQGVFIISRRRPSNRSCTMFFANWLRGSQRPVRTRHTKRSRRVRLRLEVLEDRTVPTAFTVGDVFASVSSGMVKEFHPTGTFVQTLSTGLGGFTTGSAFDSVSASANFYV